MSELANATWVASYEAVMADGTRLIPGETTARIPRQEAEQSANWHVEPAKTSKSGDR